MAEPELKHDDPPRWLVLLVIGLCLGLCIWQALIGRADMLLYGDEFLSMANLQLSFGEALGAYDHRGTGVGYLMLQKLSVALLGPTPIAYRLPATLGALGALLVLYPAGRLLVGSRATLVAAPLLASASLFIHYSRFGRAYSLLVFLTLVYVWGMERHRQSQAGDRRGLLLVALAGGLLPWFHLTSASSVAVIGLLGLWQLRGRAAQLKGLLGALVVGALLCLLLMLPAREPMLDFFQAKAGQGRQLELNALDVVALMLGTRQAAALALALCGLGLCSFLWRRPAGWLLLLAAGLTPLAALLLTRPSGLVYAFVRYQVSALPFFCLLAGWGLWICFQRLPRLSLALPLLLGLGLAGSQLRGGPILNDPASSGPFGASNLSLMSLPAFDAEWKQMPAFYRRLAKMKGPRRILELPEQISRSALLYRNYWLTHRKDVSMGFMITDKAEKIPGGPHINLRAGEHLDAELDFVIYHKEIQDELTRYWLFALRKGWDKEQGAHLLPYMQALGDFGTRFQGRKVSRALLEDLGEPHYEDRFIVVWKLR